MKANIIVRMGMIFTNEEMQRIQVKSMDGEPEIIVDLHRLCRSQARRFVKNIIALIRGAFFLELIHGFNHGTALRDMFRNETAALSDRVVSAKPVDFNDGATMLCIAAC